MDDITFGDGLETSFIFHIAFLNLFVIMIDALCPIFNWFIRILLENNNIIIMSLFKEDDIFST